MNNKFSRTFDRRLYKLDSSKIRQTYPSDAFHEGSYKAQNRSGHGLFRWSNGACYEGEFIDNKRHGEGRQEWPDGSSYQGQFRQDVREGYGRHTWFNGEIYEGTFLGDKRHGNGTYYWPNGTRYVGQFYNDLKEGFGCFYFPDLKRFEGLYKNNERNGAGILSYRDGRQDVGIWLGEKLIRLCHVMENTFLFQHFSDYFVNAGENVPLRVRRANSALAEARTINEIQERDRTLKCVNDGNSNHLLPFKSRVPQTFSLVDILDGVKHPSHGPKGPCELAGEEFLEVSGKGDCIRLIRLLEQGLVHVDVADKTGFTALLAASVNCHKDVINCLLDYGADVNKLNYEGLSALAACHVLFYTKHTWKDNIGETLAEENLFNSVYWNAQNGTFVQRKPIYYQKKTRSKINETKVCSQSHVETKYESNRENVVGNLLLEKIDQNLTNKSNNVVSSNVGNTVALDPEEHIKNLSQPYSQRKSQNTGEDEPKEEHKMNGVYTSNMGRVDYHIPSEPQSLYYLKRNGIEPSQTDISQTDMSVAHWVGVEEEKSIINITDVKSNSNSKNPRKQSEVTASVIENKGDTHTDEKAKLSSQQGSLSIKESLVQQSEIVDKNAFIHVFLHRAASARSNRDSSIYYDNIDSSNEGTFSDPYYQDGNQCNLTEDKNAAERKDVDLPKVNIAAPDTLESVQYSIQNAISSSLQTANTINDDDSLKSVEQNRQKLLTQQRRPHLEATVQLLLRRGANPNASSLPMPVLFFAIKAADAPAVKLLLQKGANPNSRLSKEKLGITPLHIAAALPSDAVSITKLLLEAGANPNLRDFAFGDAEDGRTALHTACCREDNDEDSNTVISLLLDYKADPNLLCNGHSALSLVIASGNDLAVDTLLKQNADPSLSLTNGVGSSLCAAVSFTAEKRRKIVDRMRLVNKLIRSGANILAPIVINNDHPPGTVVDYAYNVFLQDRRIAHTPYHALTPYEREIYIARRKMLDHLAELLRTHVLKKEKKLLEEQLSRAKVLQEESSEEIKEENLDRAVSFYFDETRNQQSISELGSSFDKVSIYDESHETLSCFSSTDSRFPDCGLRVAVVQTSSDHMSVSRLSINSTKNRQVFRKNRFRYCYECGRSVAVRLAACTRCKEVFYCSRNCKLKAWNSRHREECVRLSARNKSSFSKRTDSQTTVGNAHNEKDGLLSNASKDTIFKRQNSRNCSKSSKNSRARALSSVHKKSKEIVH
ncbi:ankyrin repeat and MYND domain-containing protein 1-like [Dendronephthya gigantea]|uniref:ankyrin repeat and MYND domain-containing protein 1-like n=1 Tax=Dendronephthya gigantea TaxID=151771 RepID=UPI00106DC192|nr:ankyrin repeat and MYND domain-containing protein 1-like [Dendronephthya gigantea]